MLFSHLRLVLPGCLFTSGFHAAMFCFSFHVLRLQIWILNEKCKGKDNAVPLHAWSGPEGSIKLRFPDFMTTAQEADKFVSLTHRPHLPPGNPTGTHFC